MLRLSRSVAAAALRSLAPQPSDLSRSPALQPPELPQPAVLLLSASRLQVPWALALQVAWWLSVRLFLLNAHASRRTLACRALYRWPVPRVRWVRVLA